MNDLIKYTFLGIFIITAVITLLGITKVRPFHNIEKRYLNALFTALILELVAVVMFAGKTAFLPVVVEHYKWEIAYPADLKERFAAGMLNDEGFAEFYRKYKHLPLGSIEEDELPGSVFENYVDLIFILKKAAEFANRPAKGDLFIIREDEGPTYGKAVLTFPKEEQPIAFEIKTLPLTSDTWKVRFTQPDRFVEYQGRINKWRGGLLTVEFRESGGIWSGDLIYNGVNVGRFSLDKS